VSAVIFGALTTKIIAVLGGPAGLALYGQLRQLNAMLISIATVNGGPSLVRGLASMDREERGNFLISAIAVTVFAGCVAILGTMALAPKLEAWMFQGVDADMTMAIRTLALVAIAGTASAVIISTLSGL
jgi:O-antigen/teichoic acid export membrane protein